MTTVKSFSLFDEAVKILEQMPKSERSEFVAEAILEMSKLRAMEAIRIFSKCDSKDEMSTVDLVRKTRQKAK